MNEPVVIESPDPKIPSIDLTNTHVLAAVGSYAVTSPESWPDKTVVTIRISLSVIRAAQRLYIEDMRGGPSASAESDKIEIEV